MNPTSPPNLFITGISSGLGRALALTALNRGCAVFGVSRRSPEGLTGQPGLRFAALDVTDPAAVVRVIPALFAGVDRLDLAILNAGVLGPIADMADQDIGAMKGVMETNLWANKHLLDALFGLGIPLRQVVGISSGAAVNGNRGWGGYSLSKAAFNMLIKLYARERSDTHFCALAPGVIQTPLMDHLLANVDDQRFPSGKVLRDARATPAMSTPEGAAEALLTVFPHLLRHESGSFQDIRALGASQ